MTSDNLLHNITYDRLYDVVNHSIHDNHFTLAAAFLYRAMTDWPSDVGDTQGLLHQLKKEVGNNLTYDNLDNYAKQLNLSTDAWKAEAISSLLELFDFERKNIFDKNIELETMIAKIVRYNLSDI